MAASKLGIKKNPGSKPKPTVGKKKKSSVIVVTPIGRISYPYLNTPNPRTEPAKYTASIIFPKDKWKEEGKALRQAVVQVAREFFKDDTLTLKDFQHPFVDGDENEARTDYHGHVVINLKNKQKPTVVGPDKKQWDSEDIATIKGGDYVRAAVSVFGYDNKQTGVSLGLEVIQFAKEGEAFGGGGRGVGLAMLEEMETELEELDEDDEKDESKDSEEGLEESEDEDEEELLEKEPKKKAASKKSAAPKAKPQEEEDPEDTDEDDFLVG